MGGIPYLQKTYIGGGGGETDPISAQNLDGGRDLISAGNLDLGSHICRKPRCGGSHTFSKPRCVGSHIYRKPRWGGDPISA